MADNSYEMASAYVAILPSLKGLSKELQDQIGAAMPAAQKDIGSGLSRAFAGSSTTIAKSMGSALRGVGSMAYSTLSSAVSSAGRLFGDTLKTGAEVAASTLAIAVGAVGTQVVAGGFSRALGLTQAEAQLRAMGNTAKDVEQISETVLSSIEGTSFTMPAAMETANALLTAGVNEMGALEETLQNVGTLTNMGQGEFADFGRIMSQSAATGRVQWGQMVQLMERGVPIQSALADAMGVTAQEVQDLASAGEISFEQFNAAIQKIDFDSALLAELDPAQAFGNVQAYMSKIGETFWNPLMENAAPVLGQVNDILIAILDSGTFNDIIETWTDDINAFADRVQPALERVQAWFTDDNGMSKWVEDFKGRLDGLRDSIRGLEGPAIGLGIALGSQMLSNLPVVGGLFGRIGIGVGLLGGGLVQVYQDSEALQSSFGNLGKEIGKLVGGIDGGAGNALERIGDSLSTTVDTVTKLVSGIELDGSGLGLTDVITGFIGGVNDFISQIAERSGEIKDAASGILEAFAAPFEGSDDSSIGEAVANTFVNVLELVSGALQGIIPTIVTLAETAGSVLNMPSVQGFLSGLVDIANFVVSNEKILIGLGVTLAGIFAAGKLVAGYTAMMTFMGQFGGTKTPKGKPGKSILRFITEMKVASSALVKGLVPILKGVGAATLIGGAIIAGAAALTAGVAGINALFENTGVWDSLGRLGDLGLDIAKTFAALSSPEMLATIGGVALFAAALTGGIKALGASSSTITASVAPILKAVGSLTVIGLGVLAGVAALGVAIRGVDMLFEGTGAFETFTKLGDFAGTLIESLSAMTTGEMFAVIGGVAGVAVALTGGIIALAAIGPAIVTALPTILMGIGGITVIGLGLVAAIGVLGGAIAGVSALFEATGAFDALRDLGVFISDMILGTVGMVSMAMVMLTGAMAQGSENLQRVIENLWTAIGPIMQQSADNFTGVLETSGEIITGVIDGISTGMTEIITAFGDTAESVAGSVSLILTTLSSDGVDAGVGAYAAAGGIIALAGAMTALAGGTLLHSAATGLGNLWEKFTGDGGNSLVDMAASFETVSKVITAMPSEWATAGLRARTAGESIIAGLGDGMMSELTTVERELVDRIGRMMENLQLEINMRPLEYRMPQPTTAGYGNTVNNTNTTNNTTVNTANSRVADQLIRELQGR